MTADNLKTFLAVFVRPDERDFSVVYRKGRPRRRRGNYKTKTQTIILYASAFENDFNLIGCAFHELAHHVVWHRHRAMLDNRWLEGKRIFSHGKEFKDVLDQLLGAFNYQYRELLKGLIVYSRRRPISPPRFMPFETGKAVSIRKIPTARG